MSFFFQAVFGTLSLLRKKKKKRQFPPGGAGTGRAGRGSISRPVENYLLMQCFHCNFAKKLKKTISAPPNIGDSVNLRI